MTIEFDGQNNKLGTTTANSVTIKTNDTDALTITSSQNVGIGTSSPAEELDISADAPSVQLSSTNASGRNYGLQSTNTGNFAFYDGTAGTNRMVINSSGNVLVGATSFNYNASGVAFRSGDYSYLTRDSGYPLLLNRKTNDGVLLNFYRDSTEVGNIQGAGGGTLAIGGGNTFLRFQDSDSTIRPTTNTGFANRDNAIDLGASNARFDDIFATNGTIQTSDQNEKQSIQSLTTSEIAVAQRISKLFKTFKFNSAVEEKGDSARTHTGVIAQDVQQAFSDEGLDASNYALFISSTWWEKEISVDAVAEELDEEGNVVVEGKDAYTYIDTKEEATEGYTERTRLGIRYPELLSFISSAFEQRLTNIETRLEALENE